MKIFISLLILYMLSGCGSTPQRPISYVKIRSVPEGALIQTGFKPAEGYSNVTLRLYHEELDQNGCANWNGPVTAYWASGASAQISPITLCQGPNTYEVVLQRPANHPNLNVDIQFLYSLNQAMEQERLRSQQEANAAFDAFAGLLLGAQQRGAPTRKTSPDFKYIINDRIINCRTSGSTVICY